MICAYLSPISHFSKKIKFQFCEKKNVIRCCVFSSFLELLLLNKSMYYLLYFLPFPYFLFVARYVCIVYHRHCAEVLTYVRRPVLYYIVPLIQLQTSVVLIVL